MPNNEFDNWAALGRHPHELGIVVMPIGSEPMVDVQPPSGPPGPQPPPHVDAEFVIKALRSWHALLEDPVERKAVREAMEYLKATIWPVKGTP